MNYAEVVEYLDLIGQFTEGTGVDRATRMFDSIGNPQEKLKIIHVAGTNGKGSVCSYLSSIIEKNGYKVGLFTSPHLVDIRERIQINGEMISEEDFVKYFDKVVDGINRTQTKLAYFDYLLGMAMCYFKEQGVDYCILETGLGGRLDATNAIKKPIASVITTISLEHTAILGDTVELIAAEKAGIIKKDGLLIYSAVNKAAAKVISEQANTMNCKSVPVDLSSFSLVKNTWGRIDFLIHNEYYKNDCFSIGTNALYQLENVTLALTTIAALESVGKIATDGDSTREAVLKCIWPGRMERIQDGIVVDGAHNPQGIESFVNSVNALFEAGENRRAALLFSVVNDKDYDSMVRMLCACKHFDDMYVTVTGGSRKLSQQLIEDTFNKYGKSVRTFSCVADALKEAVKSELLFCTGSLYLVGEIKEELWRN